MLLLADFPSTPEDVEELLNQGYDKFHGAFLIEETFNRDIDDEEDDDTKPTIFAQTASDKNKTLN